MLVHEVAHEWFYGMVGDDQFRDPWLDEAFATYAEALVSGHWSPDGAQRALGLPGAVGAPIGSYLYNQDFAPPSPPRPPAPCSPPPRPRAGRN